MLRFFKRFSRDWVAAQKIYDQAVQAARQPHFYQNLGVPDTLNGRFDMITLHVIAAMSPYMGAASEDRRSQDFIQALFDVMFTDIERSLREMGVGDLSIPKKVKAMMRAFNGRCRAYVAAVKDRSTLPDVIRRNVYGTVENPKDEWVIAMADYFLTLIEKGKNHEKAA